MKLIGKIEIAAGCFGAAVGLLCVIASSPLFALSNFFNATVMFHLAWTNREVKP
jgi:hypothetical protein